MALKWEGDKVTKKLRQAQVDAVNQTMAAAVRQARRNHAWRNRTGVLEGSYAIVEFARPGSVQERVRGLWGSRDVRYALIQELGGTIRAKAGKKLTFQLPDGSWRSVAEVTIPARPALRPAADVEYPKLAARIRRNYERAAR